MLTPGGHIDCKHATNRLPHLLSPQPQTPSPAGCNLHDCRSTRNFVPPDRASQRGRLCDDAEALEAQFWLPKDADHVRMLKAFADGQRRIIAVAERKVRRRPGEPVRLTAGDFQIRR
jgi:hypothetical protein